MKLSRITLNEVACRARQETAKWVDRVSFALRPSARGATSMSGHGDHAIPLWSDPEHLRCVLPRRFFPGAVQIETPGMVQRECPVAARDLLRRARRILEGRFDLLGYSDLNFGHPISWHRDPVAARNTSSVHWSRIDPLDARAVGDSKIIWELSRQQWVVTLAQAYRMSGDARFASRAVASIESWIEANPYGAGINWASSLEVALRIVSWSWALMLLRDWPPLTAERFLRIERAVRTHALHVERYLSYYFSPNTHLTGEALGLFYAGVVFADCAQAARWRDTGRRILIDELQRQVGADGIHFEQATCYHRYTIEIYLHFLMLAAHNSIAVPAEVGRTTEKMFDWLLSICDADGQMPAIGDADGGWLLPLTPREPADSRGVFALGAVMFNRPDLAWAAGCAESAPEVVWMLGADGLRRLAHGERQPPAAAASRLFAAGGYAVMRDGWEHDAHRLIVDTGPLGCPISAAHGHADLLSVQCTAFGEPYIIDPGTFCYTGDETWRSYFRSTIAHNTVVVDGHNQADPLGPFSWRDAPIAQLARWESTPTRDFVDAFHDGYARLDRPVRHRRRVLFVKPHAWVIVDDLLGEGNHTIDLRFHFSPRPVTLMNGWTRAEGRSGHGLWLTSCASQPLLAEVRDGRSEPLDGWQSTNYGTRRPIPTLVHSGVVTLPVRVTTLILPVRHLLADPPAVEIHRDDVGEPIALRLPDDDRLVRISAVALTLDGGEGRFRIACA